MSEVKTPSRFPRAIKSVEETDGLNAYHVKKSSKYADRFKDCHFYRISEIAAEGKPLINWNWSHQNGEYQLAIY